ncbi:hypothetical protein DXG03_009271 [Asterophora parasitica]|uniref:Uncharacterized protein n=1 Tax=Asterophora parasitica TaxID=117018 RepID=A0A9P7G4K2_9AGAR|nr:hypothetical protein DXG03_009271 [Asterophora parasitica]
MAEKQGSGAFYTFSSNQTRINLSITFYIVSAFFSRPISIATVYSNTFYHTSASQPAVPLTVADHPTAIASASVELPVIQRRQVYLQCSGQIVCTATSTVRITSSESAHYFLEEKYAIGQMFARMEKAPEFDLLAVGLGPVPSSEGENVIPPTEKTPLILKGRCEKQLWRKYKLSVVDFECEILEVFPSRDMFVSGPRWLDAITANTATEDWTPSKPEEEQGGFDAPVRDILLASRPRAFSQPGVVSFLGMGLLLICAFELTMFFAGRSLFCEQ